MGSSYSVAGGPGLIIRSFVPAVWRAALVFWLTCLAGCATRRTVVVTAFPSDATITIDGATQGRGRVEKRLNFSGGQVHTVLVERLGFSPQMITLAQPPFGGSGQVKLEAQTKRV